MAMGYGGEFQLVFAKVHQVFSSSPMLNYVHYYHKSAPLKKQDNNIVAGLLIVVYIYVNIP